MGRYIIRRLLWAVVVVFCVSLITFLLAFAIPADPAKQIAGPHATPQVLAQIRHSLSLDRPLYYQYGLYMWHIAHGNLGYSYINQLPVTQSILQRFPATLMVALVGILFELIIGIPIGILSALRQYSAADRSFTVFSLLGIAAPTLPWCRCNFSMCSKIRHSSLPKCARCSTCAPSALPCTLT